MIARTLLALLFAIAAFAAEGRNIVDYRISAALNAQTHTIEGSEILTWRNESKDQIAELRFHLYMNAFRDKKSSLVREGEPEVERLERGGWGSIDITRMEIAGGADLTRAIRFIQPDDGNQDDRTVIAVPLPSPVPAGGSITLAIRFRTKLPHVVRRTGFHGGFHMAAQWFPKIGVWEAAGERYATKGQWNCHQFHLSTEFYADYGRYDVRITAPSDYVVGATGAEVETRREGSTTTHRFVQSDVHDFAWTASPRFQRLVRTFDPAREVQPRELRESAALLGLAEGEVRLTPVRMILLIQPEHASQIERHFRALETAIKDFGLAYGAYPYGTITLVDPPYGAVEAGGMEYPTLITAGTNWLDSPFEQEPEMVIVHEYGHQYWYGLVGNNEFEESWLDEGFNTYSTSKILDRRFPQQPYSIRLEGVNISPLLGLPQGNWDAHNRADYLVAPKADDIVRNGWEYYDHASYRINSYTRPGIVLKTLENYLGRQTMARAMRTYHQRWRYRHPSSLDFLAVVNEVSDRDMKWFFDQFVFGSNVVDYAAAGIDSKEVEGRKNTWESTVHIRRLGEAVFPVDVRVRFKDGRQADRHWDGQYRWTELKFIGPSEVASVEIDPEHKILLDVNFANNSLTKCTATGPLLKWSVNLLFWAQQLLLGLAGVA